MRRLLCPILLLAAPPALAGFCDGDPQVVHPPGGEQCTLTRVAHPDPLSGKIVGDYSELQLDANARPSTLSMDINISALPGSSEKDVTLFELGITRDATQITEATGGTLSLDSRVFGSDDGRPQLGWTWFEGSSQSSALYVPATWQTASTVTPPRTIPPMFTVEVRPEPDWCHLHVLVTDNGGTTLSDWTYRSGGGSRCSAVILRAGVMGNDLEDGMSAFFRFRL